MPKRIRGRLRRPSPALVLAFVAVTVAFGGTATGESAITAAKKLITGKQIQRSAITSRQVKNGSLLAKDFKARQLPRGPKGDIGPAGPPGATGPQGLKGDKGDPGTPATRLFVNVRPDCASFEDGSGVVSIALEAPARCDVRFDRDLTGCVASVTEASSPGELVVGEPGDDYGGVSFFGLDSDEIAVVYKDSAGANRTANRQPFSLAVFC